MEEQRSYTKQEVIRLKKGFVWVVLTIAFAALSAILGVQVYVLSRSLDSQAVVATVNGEAITKADLYNDLVARSGKQVLQGLIEDRLIAQEAKKQGIQVTKQEMQAEIDNLRKEFPSELAFQAFLAERGVTQERLEQAVSRTLTLKKLVEPRARERLTGEALKKYFEDNRDKYDQPERVRARHILLKTREEAEAVLGQLKSGADFAQLAREKSIDTMSGQQGGDLGLFTRGQMVPEFEKAAFELPVGQISGVVQSPFGFHIIQVTEHQQARQARFEEVRDKVRQDALDDELGTLIPQWLDEMKSKATITNTLEPAPAPRANPPAPQVDGASQGGPPPQGQPGGPAPAGK